MRRADENKIDRQFRKGLTETEGNSTFREEDWDAMEAMLDKEQRGRRRIGWMYWISAGVAAVLLILMVRIFSPSGSNDNTTAERNDGGKKMVPGLTDTVKQGDQLAGKEMSPGDSVKDHHPAGRKEGVLPVSGRSDNGYGVQIAATGAPGSIPVPAGGDSSSYSVPESIPVISQAEPREEAVEPEESPVKERTENVPELQAPKRVKISLALVTAPDLNGVNSLSGGQLGVNGGLLLNLDLRKWRFTTGVTYASKPYQANYNPQAGAYGDYGYGTRQLRHIDADCKVLDIPLNVSFQFFARGKNGLSVGSGLSSYIMLRERYSFTYTDYTEQSYAVANRNKHLAGVLNLNITYQRRLNDKFGLLVQPYYKVPLTGIGNEGVDLRSAGVAVGVGWDIGSMIKK